VLLGDWLRLAGPMGSIVGFVAGGVLMTLIAGCYAELTARMPQTGGEFLYSLHIFGPQVAFIVGWFLTLSLVAFAVFEAISLAWILQTLLPSLAGAQIYASGGEPITVDALVIGVTGAVLFTTLNCIGVKAAATFQSVVTYGFLIVASVVIALGGWLGSPRNLQPLWNTGSGQPWWHGAAWILATCAGYLNGFQAVPQAIEERAPDISLRAVGRIMILAVVAATLFYCMVVVATSMARPWPDLAGKELATTAAFKDLLPRGILADVILITAAASVLKTWNVIVLMAGRLILAQARHGFLPSALANLHQRFGTPARAILAVGALNVAGVFAGRAAILPIITTASICLVIALAVSCLGLIVVRRRDPRRDVAFRVPGGAPTAYAGFCGALLMTVVAFVEAWSRAGGVIPVEFTVMIAWALVGSCFMLTRRRRLSSEGGSIRQVP
jgi:amino acid transporter